MNKKKINSLWKEYHKNKDKAISLEEMEKRINDERYSNLEEDSLEEGFQKSLEDLKESRIIEF